MFTVYSEYVDMLNRIGANPGVAATLVFPAELPFSLSPDRMADFSGRGPNLDLNIKPDLVAVGENMVDTTETLGPFGAFFDPSD